MMQPDEALDPLGLDRSIARVAGQARRYLRLARVDPEQAACDAWFAFDRVATTRTTFVRVSALPSTDPLRDPLRRWVYALALTRIAQPMFIRASAARHALTITLEKPDPGIYSAKDIVARWIDDTASERQQLWLEGLAGGVRAVRAAERHHAEALREIETRLGASTTTRKTVNDERQTEASAPENARTSSNADARAECDTPLSMPYTPDAIARLARDVLSATDDLAAHLLRPCSHLGDRIAQLIARDAPGAWPANLGTRWLDEMFGRGPLLEGLDLDFGPVVRPIGVSSWARVLARFGSAYARAAAARELPFSIAHDPTQAHPLRRGALFGSLVADPVFLRARLGFSRETARAAVRHVAVTLLGAARLDAVRTLLDFATAAPADVEGAMEQAWRCPYPRSLAAVLPRPCRLAPVRLAAIVLAVVDRAKLVDEFDEDWFRNPRGLHRLREMDAMPPEGRVAGEVLDHAARRFAEAIASLAG